MLENSKKRKLDHVAIIMDGNGRWAKKQGFLRLNGHRAGVDSVRRTVEVAIECGVGFLTLYVFSTENWNRPVTEIAGLMNLLYTNILKEGDRLNEQGVRVKFIGDSSKLENSLQKGIVELEEKTKDNKTMDLILALNYGAREEILLAVKEIVRQTAQKEINESSITEDTINKCLFTKGIPDVDLVIRTSGEQRISNFMLWQIAYAELYFTDVLWPDFSKDDFKKALEWYSSRERRFGKTSEQLL